MSLTVQTKVWENDWRIILQTDRLARLFALSAPAGSYKLLLINNVDNLGAVKSAAAEARRCGTIDEYVVVSDCIEEALSHFQLTREQLGIGLYYSSAELVGILRCRTEFLLHFAGDAIPRTSHENWLGQCLQVLRDRPDVVTSALAWSEDIDQVNGESEWEDEAFSYNLGFSDQMFIARAGQLQQPIYSEAFPGPSPYPSYGGELFEKRANAWMRNHRLLRATFKGASYEHRNFSKFSFLRRMAVLTGNPYFAEPVEMGLRRIFVAARDKWRRWAGR